MISIYASYFAPARVIETKHIKPIQVGRAVAKYKLDMPGDDTGENISERNPEYCELTAVYWAWKNDLTSDYIGSLHYRRFFDFRQDRPRDLDPSGAVVSEGFEDDFFEQYGLEDAHLAATVRQFDAIIPLPFDVASVGSPNVEKHYARAPHHHLKDLHEAGRAIAALSPDYLPYFHTMLEGRLLFPNNMFIFKRGVFEQYCEWVFPILQRLDEQIDVTHYSAPEKRALGYLAERLFTVFALHLLERRDVQVLQLRRVFVSDTSLPPSPPLLPQTARPIISVVASSDRAYLPHLGALVASVLSNADPTKHIDFVVLDGGLQKQDRKALAELSSLHPSASISFLDVSRSFLSLKTHTYFTRGTFFRLSMPSLLWNRNKVLFLDTDMVVLGDVAELFDTSLDGKLVAAVPDLVMRAFVAKKVPALLEAGGQEAGDYLSNTLGMGDKADQYFQAGTMLFDLNALRASGLPAVIISDLRSNIYWFLDQDALNKHLLGRVKFIDHRWNSLFFDRDHQQALKPEDLARYEQSQDEPLIIHFAGTMKPWLGDEHPLSRYYWRYLRLTAWYEPVLARYLHAQGSGGAAIAVPPVRSIAWQSGRKVWSILPKPLKSKLWPVAIRVRSSLLTRTKE